MHQQTHRIPTTARACSPGSTSGGIRYRWEYMIPGHRRNRVCAPHTPASPLGLKPHLRFERWLVSELEAELLVGSVAEELRRLVKWLEALPIPSVVRIDPPLCPLLEQQDL